MKKPLAAEWFVWADGSCAGSGHRFTELYSYTAGGLTTVKKLYVKLNDTNWPNAIADLGVMRQLDYSWGQTAQVYQMTYPADSGGNRRQLTYAYDGMQRPSVLTEGSPVPLITGITYGPGNEMKTLQHLGWSVGGAGYYYQEQRQHNSRLQLTRITGNFLDPGCFLREPTKLAVENQFLTKFPQTCLQRMPAPPSEK